MSRPTFIDLQSKSFTDAHTGLPSPRPAPSPRMQHFAGDVPPAMSPLDLFAAQSRLLARQLEDGKSDGRRVSRLPPLTTTDPITKQQTMYSRSGPAAAKDAEPMQNPRAKDDESSGTVPEVEEPQFRPKSFYPRMSTVPQMEDDDGEQESSNLSPEDQPFMTPAEFQTLTSSPKDYFSAPRGQRSNPSALNARPIEPSGHAEKEATLSSYGPERGLSIESTSSKSHSNSLAPPRSPLFRQAASTRSFPLDSSDEENSASTHDSGFSHHRKLSSSSGVSLPNSPFPPFAQAHGRSPSLNSEHSIGGSRHMRSAFNFSRPLSRDSRPSMESTSRKPSFDSRPSLESSSATNAVRPPVISASREPSPDSQRFIFVDDTVQTPVSVDYEQFPESKNPHAPPAPSYIYTKYSLPRGRILSRDKKAFEDEQTPISDWEQPRMQSDVRPSTPPSSRHLTASPSPRNSPRPSTDLRGPSSRPSMEQRSRESPRPSFEQRYTSSPQPSWKGSPSSSPRPSTDQVPKLLFRPSGESTRSMNPRPHPTPVMNDDQSKYSASTRSGSTIKASSRQPALSVEPTAEDHLAKGIALHEKGVFQESTYHLRVAARQNLPTAMLLYALACRHGWGMRKNPQEGVLWLRKAADFASLEIAIDEDAEGKSGDALERKTRRAQFALSIYELGMSHTHGWGIEVDKVLALRCFEIAGNWGDADALAQAGFCYAQGEGCKKDMKKAAGLYRMAEKKGISMVGNSWYFASCFPDTSWLINIFIGSTNPSMPTTIPSAPVATTAGEALERPAPPKRKPEINRGQGQSSAGRSLFPSIDGFSMDHYSF